MAELSDAESVRRLVDRLGFGAGGDTLAGLQSAGYEATVDLLLAPTGPDAGVTATPVPRLAAPERPGKATKTAGAERQDPPDQPDQEVAPADRAARKTYRRALKAQQLTAAGWWLDRMVRAQQPARERLTWFWHGHFATSVQKVRVAGLMLEQNETLRGHALGSFGPLAKELVVDPAMLIWLDGNDNTAEAPNENLARELMELFALGHGQFGEADVKEAARALTGWKVNRATGAAQLRPKQHDDGSKTVLGHTGDLDAEQLVDVLLGRPASAEFVVGRLWFRLVGPQPPSAPTYDSLLSAYGADRDVTATLRAIAAAPELRDPATSLVKQPVEWVVGTARALGVVPSSLTAPTGRTGRKKTQLDENGEPGKTGAGRLLAGLRGLGQVPFRPPSVGGWPDGGAWLTTAAAASRLSLARALAAQADLAAVSGTSTRSRTEAIRRLLGVDAFSTRTADAIAAVADRPADAVALAAVSPEYVVSR
ncbi:MAG TPA: DUF1800 domain-containing protein [Microlunatus sp.]